MAKLIAKVLGIVLLLVGVAGFFAPALLGAHLSLVHDIVHLVTGALAVWFGFKGSMAAVRTFDIAFGAVYALLGAGGFVLGVAEGTETHLLKVLPGLLELGTVDHVIHVLVGLVFLIAGLATRPTR